MGAAAAPSKLGSFKGELDAGEDEIGAAGSGAEGEDDVIAVEDVVGGRGCADGGEDDDKGAKFEFDRGSLPPESLPPSPAEFCDERNA